ncbi:MAG TPA: fibronectin type III domain-containing protein [Solirubrobacteraceae bacterium]|jgi:hypothetical protein|nr:fibronectin type III domain-containing protein [Solirubrobacteraceae bacterium]
MSDLDDRDDGLLAERPREGGRPPRARRVAVLAGLLVLVGGLALARLPMFAAAATSTSVSWSAPLAVDTQYPYADPNSVTALTCPSTSLCVGAAGFPSEIIASSQPTGTSTSDWSQLASTVLAGDSSGYSLRSVSCVPGGGLCAASGIGTAGVILTSSNPTAQSWTPANISDANDILAVQCPSASLCVALDSAGNILATSTPPTGWSTSTSPIDTATGAEFTGLSCTIQTGTPLCVAVDDEGDAYVTNTPTTLTSASWVEEPTGMSDADQGVQCMPSSYCVAFSQFGEESIDPTTAPVSSFWEESLTGLGDGNEFTSPIACTADTNLSPNVLCLLGTESVPSDAPGVSTSTDGGNAWPAPETVPAQPGFPSAVSCPPAGGDVPATCVAGTSQGAIINSTDADDGTPSWSGPVVAAPGSSPLQLGPQSCASAALCVASDGEGRVYTSTTPPTGGWSNSTIDAGESLTPAACPSTSACVVGADDGDMFYSGDGGSSWTADQVDSGTPIDQVECPSASLCLALDDAGNVLSTPTPGNGGWQITASDAVAPFFPGPGQGGLACPSTSLCVEGSNGNGSIYSSAAPATGSWSSTTTATDSISGISCPSTQLCVAFDNNGNVLTSTTPTTATSASWTETQVESNSGNPLLLLSCPSTGLCVGVTFQGSLVTTTDPTGGSAAWTSASLDPSHALTTLNCPSTSLCLATDSAGNAFTSTDPAGGASTWTASDIDGTQPLTAAACASSALCLVGDENGDLLNGQVVTTSSSTPNPPAAPTVTAPARAATVLGSTSAQLHGAVNPDGQATTYFFQWGLNSSYGKQIPATPASVGAGTSPVSVSQTLTNLAPDTTYHFRLVATSAGGTSYGPAETFTTLPLPVLDKTVNVVPISGTVLVQLPPGTGTARSVIAGAAKSKGKKGKNKKKKKAKGQPFIPLTQAREIPVKSKLNTTKGTVELFSATTAHSTPTNLQSGDFNAGVFQVLQTRKQKGLTTLSLTGGLNRAKVCKSAHKAGLASAAKLSSKVLRLLKSSAHGSFATRGSYSSATARGTQWKTVDQCNGTLTEVQRGVVSVEVLRTRRKITLKAGKHYLAKA